MRTERRRKTFEPVLSGKGCDKATDFIHFCDAFNIPVLTLVNVKGYKAKMCSREGLQRQRGLTYAYANASVPR